MILKFKLLFARSRVGLPVEILIKDYNEWLTGVVKYFALSSGTTGSPSKRIPVTKQMIRSFQRTTIKQFAATSRLDLSPVFYQKSFLAVGGSTKLEHVGNHIEGDLSGEGQSNSRLEFSRLNHVPPSPLYPRAHLASS